MKSVVVYHSKTGHSKKLARAVAQALETVPLDIQDFKRPPAHTLLFIVSGVYAGKTDPALLSFASGLSGSPVTVALISSCASGRDERQDLRDALRAAGIPVLPERFICPGSFLFLRWGRPNVADCQAAADFALKLARQMVQ